MKICKDKMAEITDYVTENFSPDDILDSASFEDFYSRVDVSQIWEEDWPLTPLSEKKVREAFKKVFEDLEGYLK